MRFPLIILFSVVLLNFSSGVAQAETDPFGKDDSLILQDDPFQKKKSDTAIKPFVFPKSLKVVQACLATPHKCLFYSPGYGPEFY